MTRPTLEGPRREGPRGPGAIRRSRLSALAALGLCIVVLCGATVRTSWHAGDIPAFARQYRTACSTCHTAAPKLNVLGEAFRLNGYRMPATDLLVRHDGPVPLGNDAWKDQWPRAIWPGELPGQPPFALRIQSDLQATNDESSASEVSYRFPNEIYLLAGTTLGEGIATFLETEWSREEGLEVVQAKMAFQDPLPMLPDRLLNVWVGMQNPYLFTFADRQIDRASRQGFRWQSFRPADAQFLNPTTADELGSSNEFHLGLTEPSIELNGLLTGRLYWGAGVGQGAGEATADNNGYKDVYYKLRYKFGGLDLQGAYGPSGHPVPGAGGQLLDRSLTVEHFGYFGGEPAPDGSTSRHRSFGVNARALYGPWDVGVGFVRATHENAWSGQAPGDLVTASIFGKAEYLVFPWLMGSAKFERFQADIPDEARALGYTDGEVDEVRVMPGFVALLRQNIRGVLEVDWSVRDAARRAQGLRRPVSLWLRLDIAF